MVFKGIDTSRVKCDKFELEKFQKLDDFTLLFVHLSEFSAVFLSIGL